MENSTTCKLQHCPLPGLKSASTRAIEVGLKSPCLAVLQAQPLGVKGSVSDAGQEQSLLHHLVVSRTFPPDCICFPHRLIHNIPHTFPHDLWIIWEERNKKTTKAFGRGKSQVKADHCTWCRDKEWGSSATVALKPAMCSSPWDVLHLSCTCCKKEVVLKE